MNDERGKLYIFIDVDTLVDTLIFSKDVDENGINITFIFSIKIFHFTSSIFVVNLIIFL
jgi:hypothetical protein